MIAKKVPGVSFDPTVCRESHGLTSRQKGEPSNLECVGLSRSGGTQRGAENLRCDIRDRRCGAVRQNGSDQSSKVLRLEAERDDRGSCGYHCFSPGMEI